MKAKIIGMLVFLALALSIGIVGLGAVSQAVNAKTGNGTAEKVFVQYKAAPAGANASEDSPVYAAFTFVCPLH